VTDVARLAREQFRTTTLLEGCGESLDQLGRTIGGHIDQQLGQQAEGARALGALEEQIRIRLATDLLPVLDALQASIIATRGLIAADRQTSASQVHRGLHVWRLVQRFLGSGRAGVSEADHLAALEGSLGGLELVERRLMALLEREGVRPIAAVGRTFDPHYHLAVAASDECIAADGTVIAEDLRGYTLGDRVLRHAEVVVARTNRPANAQGRSPT
jgi:molecular chaperone GrpE (heat shock protein)